MHPMNRYPTNELMRLPILGFLTLVLSSVTLLGQTNTPEGRWKTIDDDTGEVKSIIEIYRRGNAYHGRVAEILTGNTDALCTECSGEKKDAPILGMVIIEDLVADDEPKSWTNGTIFDPQKGATYGLSAWYEDNPDVLYIRGRHWTGLYRTQQWLRE